MQRTEILLEDSQYQCLLKEAKRLKISLAELLSKVVEGYLTKNMPPDSEDPLEKLVGIGRGTGEAIGRQHNRWLYGEHME
jgi:hypothetical protein